MHQHVRRFYTNTNNAGEQGPCAVRSNRANSRRPSQELARRYLEPILEPVFHTDSYGYRPGKSAIDAVHQTRQRCWRYDWVLDLDVQAYFDSIDWELLLKAVRHHTDCPWLRAQCLITAASSAVGTRLP